jgi:hypothetical protein
MTKVVVKESSIQGKGVFALIDIRAGEEVLEIDDTHVVKDGVCLTKHQQEFECDYLDNGKVVLMQPPEVYINHSCDPSVYTKTTNGIRKVIAMRNISKGEEITYDYSMNGDNEGTFRCGCGSENCRKIYQGNFFKLPEDLQKKYLPYLDGWFVVKYKEKIGDLRNK